MIEVDKFREYTERPDSAWNSVEKNVFEYVFKRYLKNRYNWLNLAENRLVPAITTKFGNLIPDDFRVLDLGTGTGHIPKSLSEIGVKTGNIIGVDNNPEMLNDVTYPTGVNKLCADAINFLPTLKAEYPNIGNFDLVTASMVFHLLSFGDYIRALKQVRKVVTANADLYIMVPHPLRDYMDSIPDYHKRGKISETAPWGGDVMYGVKTVSDYQRGLREAGFSSWIIRSTGVRLELEGTRLLEDSAIWSLVQDRKRGTYTGTLPHYFRLWLMARPIKI